MVERIAKASKVPVLNTHRVLEGTWTSSGQSPLCRGFCRHTPHAAILQVANLNVRKAYNFQDVLVEYICSITIASCTGTPKASIPLPFSVYFFGPYTQNTEPSRLMDFEACWLCSNSPVGFKNVAWEKCFKRQKRLAQVFFIAN